ncbi:antibiotic biosynthesis monooxygenase [Domibacillus sp. PGB-M46]|uniref:antibiotic biosynthesis monooxygenase family protein n=1 Tax=Domibacillus sp. PGB-M46 TaxID=2910255 RepID=UPI001F571661|nr:antibiotic biosynthesis monooxygenase [Domibacillus sp. PGB-M46]MCI2252899.1 antibiotic biosynthesis monooxygenase [Domibacillus sp. PGB-M46]
MFVEMKTITVKPGTSHLVVENFQGKNAMAEMDGFIDKKIWVRSRSKEDEKVIVAIHWESEEAYKGWKKSPIHIAGHRTKREKPDYILDFKNETFVEASLPASV